MQTIVVVSLLALLAAASPAQCCLGAQDAEVDSPGGRYRVEAISQTGTGHAAHGPYRFLFRTLRFGLDGEPELIGEFERAWDSRAHFSMQIAVSPTGNGFLLGSSLEQGLRFFAPDGTVLCEIPCRHDQSLWPDRTGSTPLHRMLYSSTRNAAARRTWMWLPLCHVTGPELRRVRVSRRTVKWQPVEGPSRWQPFADDDKRWLMRMLTWSPARGESERLLAERWLALLEVDCKREAASARLVDLGLSAAPVLRAALEDDAELEAVVQPILATIRARLCGHEQPHRHRELLTALLQHPDADLRATARGRLRALAGK